LNIKIKDIPSDDRPRERLLTYGASSLSNEELISILLNSGSKKHSVKTLASKILSEAGSVKKLNDLNYQKLTNIDGIGDVKACTILAFNELAKRVNRKEDKILGGRFTSPDLIFNYYKDKVDPDKEQVYCLYLNSDNKIIKEKLLFVGTVNRSMVHPRDIFKMAYEVNASSIICMHNHPSDNTTPSKEDIEITKRLKEISYLMGIDFLDHIIIGKTNYYSFMENGKL